MEQKISGKFKNYYFSKAINRRYSESTQHHHPHYEIYYMKYGNCRYFIDDRAYNVEAGDIIFIPKGIIHRTNYTSDCHSRLLINFTDEYIPDEILSRIDNQRFIYRSKEIIKNIEQIFNKIETEYNNLDELSEQFFKCYTVEMLLLILRHPGKNERTATTGNDLIDDTLKYIKENYMSDIKLSSVAKLKSISPEHLSRTFKRCTGLGFNEYVTLLRLRRAEEMIRTEPNMTISEIAYECGFNDGNYFSYKFKKIYGVSPMKARPER